MALRLYPHHRNTMWHNDVRRCLGGRRRTVRKSLRSHPRGRVIATADIILGDHESSVIGEGEST